MDFLLHDIRFGVRMLLKRPGTSALAILALALGIGLTTTMFSIVNGAFLRGLPFERADRILYAGELVRDRGDGRPGGMPVDDLVEFRKTQTAFEEVAAFNNFSANVAAEGVSPVRYGGSRLTPNSLHVLRMRPAMGRDFLESDAIDGAPPVAIISDVIWTNQFARDPNIVSKVIRVNGQAATVIGVMGPRFGFPQTQNLWMPLTLRAGATRKDSPFVEMFGRLKDTADASLAHQQTRAVAERIAATLPNQQQLTGAAIPFVRRFINNQVVITLSTMLVAVFGVLLIACVNVTNLQLARAADRVREVGIRLAMGASRGRMIRQLLVEGLMLAAAGTLLGLGIAQAGVNFFMAGIADTTPPFWIVADLDTRVLLFATTLTVIAALASSLVPAFRVTRQDLQSVLKDSGRSNTSLSMGRFTRVLVAAEIMLSFILLVVSGLMIKSVVVINRLEYPFHTDRFQARIELSDRDYKDAAAIRQTTDRLLDELKRAPGLSRVALSTAMPDRSGDLRVLVDGETKPSHTDDFRRTRRIAVSPEFFDVMGVKLKQGRLLDNRDGADQLRTALVSEDFAAKFFPNGDAIGRRMQFQVNEKDELNPWWTVVGILGRLTPTAQAGNQGTAEVVVVPLAQQAGRSFLMLAEAPSGDPLQLAAPVRKAVASINPDLPVYEVDTVANSYRAETWPFRVFGTLFMAFGFAALIMAAAGLYGVMAFSVRRRTPEIGVRMALGADQGDILKMVMRQGTLLVAIGMVLGVGIAGYLGGQLKLLLFGVQPWDPTVFSIVTVVLGTSGLLATFIPARKASSVPPTTALRAE